MDNHDYTGEAKPIPKTPAKLWVNMVLKPLASLQVTIVLFVLGLLLVFYGTLAQKYDSLNTVLNDYFYCWVSWLDLNLTSDFTSVFFNFRIAGTVEDRVTFRIPFPGGFTLGWAMVVNLVAAHIVRFQLSWKRAGIWILHAGMIVLLVGEYVRANYADEHQLQLYEGDTSNALVSLEKSEVALMTSKDGINDEVVSIPGTLLEKHASNNTPLQHPDLPFDIKVERYMRNTSEALLVTDSNENKATAGFGRVIRLEGRDEVSSIRGNGKTNNPGCYLTFVPKSGGEPLGTYVLGQKLQHRDPQTLKLGDQEWRISFRMKHKYLPFNVTAEQVERVNWPNSEKPKEFKSRVTVTNPTTNETKSVWIEMNSPLRQDGYTFYQSQMVVAPEAKFTVLQVVRNPGSTIPYIACILITFGMLLHFLVRLAGYLEKRAVAATRKVPTAPSSETTSSQPSSLKKNWLPAVGIGLLAIVAIAMGAKPKTPSDTAFDYDQFGTIPVLHQGRYMPLDTVARHHLLLINGGKEKYRKNYKDSSSHSAMKFLLETMSAKDDILDCELIRISDLRVVQFLRLERRGSWWRYSYNEVDEALRAKRSEVDRMLKKARDPDPDAAKLTDFEESVLQVRGHMNTIAGLRALRLPGMLPNPEDPNNWLALGEVDDAQIRKAMNDTAIQQQANAEAQEFFDKEVRTNPQKFQRLIAEVGDQEARQRILQYKEALKADALVKIVLEKRAEYSPQSAQFHKILKAYEENNITGFNEAVRDYHAKYVAQLPTEPIRHVGKEYFLNRFAPFTYCIAFYVLAMVLAAGSWVGYSAPMRNAALLLNILVVILHTSILILRIYISDKPPVTNLYSSAVFIGWGCVLLCIGIDFYFRNAIPTFLGALSGASTLLIANFLESNGDTMPRVEAVLNTNFWLATHVIIVTLGYTATYVAGLWGLIYILGGMFTNTMRGDLGREVYAKTYGITCFATLLSFVGTVLGGFWADDSWGRFWGWDPKENGAVLVVMWNTLNLHLRWSGMVKARGFCIFALLGIGVTTWSWFGTNQLGLGLHAYGFDKSLADGCALSWIGVGLLSLLGFVPLKHWASFGPAPTSTNAKGNVA